MSLRLALPSVPRWPRPGRQLRLVFCPSCSIWRLARPSAPTDRRKPPAELQKLRQRPRLLPWPRRSQHTPAISAATTINAPADVRPEFKALCQALERLKRDAGIYVNLSRLELALRGLQKADPVVRVAILTLDGQRKARRLARVLLADPLIPEGEWEKKLEEDLDDGRPLLLRYGEESETAPYNPLLRTIFVPSRILQQHNIELLITGLNVNGVYTGSPTTIESKAEAILVPALQTPVSMSGRHGIVTNPVHKAIIFGDGIQSSIDFGRVFGSANDLGIDSTLGTAAFNISSSAGSPEDGISENTAVVDVDLAASAVDSLRDSVSNSSTYDHNWRSSNLPSIIDWLTAHTSSPTPAALNPSVEALISSLLNTSSTSLEVSASQRSKQFSTPAIPSATQTSILSALDVWAESAHTELRDSLAVAFSSRAWSRLKWWKLLWRVDDVASTCADLLARHWLPEAEKGVIFVAGRMEESGFFWQDEKKKMGEARKVQEEDWRKWTKEMKGFDSVPPAANTLSEKAKSTADPSTSSSDSPAPHPYHPTAARSNEPEPDDRWGTSLPPTSHPSKPSIHIVGAAPQTLQLTDLAAPHVARARRSRAEADEIGLAVPAPASQRPWPQHIALARAHLAATTIPGLHAVAQGCVMRALNGSAGSAAVGGLVYATLLSGGGEAVAAASSAGFEAGAVTAFGFAWVLRSVQTRWEGERERWVGRCEEEGREALKVTEAKVREVVRRAAEPRMVDEVAREDEEHARSAVERCLEALKGLKKG